MSKKSQFASFDGASTVTADRRLEHWPLERLRPYAGNARTHTHAQIAQLAASIEQFGFTNPILARSDGTVAAGHGRLEAAKLLGLEQVPVIVIDGWTEAQFMAYALADNQLALNAGWDEDLLAAELKALSAAKFDLGLLGFDQRELGRALAVGLVPPADLDDVPELSKAPVSMRGDIWLCGDHRVMCGDATDRADIDRLLDGQRAALCFADPPYNVDYGRPGGSGRKGRGRPILNDALGSEFGAFLRSACSTILGVTDGAVYICMSSAELNTLQRAFQEAGGKWSTFVIW
ncbi:MAG: site-specific DNA-methyltransferase, partial [Hyphomicrobiales bacterium]|nr:site-specific DNA-methyltransferase [Hyphomicrobiales bacterium]